VCVCVCVCVCIQLLTCPGIHNRQFGCTCAGAPTSVYRSDIHTHKAKRPSGLRLRVHWAARARQGLSMAPCLVGCVGGLGLGYADSSMMRHGQLRSAAILCNIFLQVITPLQAALSHLHTYVAPGQGRRSSHCCKQPFRTSTHV